MPGQGNGNIPAPREERLEVNEARLFVYPPVPLVPDPGGRPTNHNPIGSCHDIISLKLSN